MTKRDDDDWILVLDGGNHAFLGIEEEEHGLNSAHRRGRSIDIDARLLELEADPEGHAERARRILSPPLPPMRWLCPVLHFEGTMNVTIDRARRQSVNVDRPVRVSAVLGLVSLRGLSVSASLPVIRVAELGRHERDKIMTSLSMALELIEKLRADDAGITVTSAMPEGRG